jgi:hypothetical protein
MLAHTFAGTTLRSLVGLEREEAAFERFRQHRRAERDMIFPDDALVRGLQERPA